MSTEAGGVHYKPFGVGSADLGAMGVMQTELTTIELGFAPFVPLSQLYYQQTLHTQTDMPLSTPKGVRGNTLQSEPVAFKFMPNEGTPNEEWLSRLKSWSDSNYGISEMVEQAPTAVSEATRLSKALSDILEGTTVTSKYTTRVKGELEEQALISYLLEDTQTGQRMYSPTLDARHRQMEQSLNTLSQETFDLVSQNDLEQDVLEYTLQGLASALDDEDFVRDVRALETTTMVKDKMFVGQARTIAQTNQLSREEFEMGVVTSLDAIDRTIKEQSTNIYDAYKQLEAIKAPGKQKGGYKGQSFDSAEYMGKQIADRVYRLMTDWSSEGDPDEASFIFQVPVNKTLVGYVSIWGKGTTDNYEGLGHDIRYASTIPPAGYEWIEKYYAIIPEADSWTASHYNVLLLNAVVNYGVSQSEVARISERVSLDFANHQALGSNRGQMIGSAINQEIYFNASSKVGNVGVEMIEVLSTQEVASELQKQIAQYFLDPTVQNTMSRLYSQATQDSEIITNQWKQSLGAMTNDSVFGPPYTSIGSDTLAKIGMPFWMTMGRNAAGYKIFGTQFAESKKHYSERDMWHPPSKYVTRTGLAPKGQITLLPGEANTAKLAKVRAASTFQGKQVSFGRSTNYSKVY